MEVVQANQYKKGMSGILTRKDIEIRKKKIKIDEKDESEESIDIADSSSSSDESEE